MDVKDSSKLKGVIGLEIHAQIATKTKLFSSSRNEFGGAVNTQVSYFDAALPGTLPVLNKECVTAGVKSALALNCKVQKVSKFDRKHYFYADLPPGYQITQQRMPLAVDGRLDFVVYNPAVLKVPYEKSVHIIQLQLEQDSGKSLHDEDGGYSLIDLNRAGTGLMEIITHPDLSNGEEAAAFVKELQSILVAIGACDGKMEEGSMRVDANISVHRPGEAFGVRTEVKNINSVRNVAKAIEFEIARQIAVISEGGEVTNETRSFDMETDETVPMRDKEIKQDYRFMPEPNLPPLRLYDDTDKVKGVNPEQVINIDSLRSSLPELPGETRALLQERYGLSLENSIFLVNSEGMVEYFEDVMKTSVGNAKTVFDILKIDLTYYLKERQMNLKDCGVSAEKFGELCTRVDSGLLSKNMTSKALLLMLENPAKSLTEIVNENGLFLVTDAALLEKWCVEVIEEYPGLVKKYKSGKQKIFHKLVNLVVVKSDERASGKHVVEVMTKLLKE